MLETRALVKHYRSPTEIVHAVDGVSLSIAAGEFVAMYGPSGSGKSTLLNLIAGFRAPDSGQVIVQGCDIATFTEKQHADYLRNVVGVIGRQDELLPDASARENAALKLFRTKARRALREIEPLLIELGLQSRMDHPMTKLSMGERQRVIIARALSTAPRLVIADEPTGNLDTRRSRDILSLLRQLCQHRKTAVLLATHDPQAVAYADRAYVLSDGQLRDYRPDDVFVRLGAATTLHHA
ncbi:MAG TPA: ABC transporter ATP-binding protein [Solirubrobacteraceae bacterium]|nr:ABC transporter ATP-binding protein [Solirubrobacteraceae bacterium]